MIWSGQGAPRAFGRQIARRMMVAMALSNERSDGVDEAEFFGNRDEDVRGMRGLDGSSAAAFRPLRSFAAGQEDGLEVAFELPAARARCAGRAELQALQGASCMDGRK